MQNPVIIHDSRTENSVSTVGDTEREFYEVCELWCPDKGW